MTTKVEELSDHEFLLNLIIELFQEIRHWIIHHGHTKVHYAMDARDNREDHLQEMHWVERRGRKEKKEKCQPQKIWRKTVKKHVISLNLCLHSNYFQFQRTWSNNAISIFYCRIRFRTKTFNMKKQHWSA